MNNPNKQDLIRQVFKQLLAKKKITSYRLAKETGIDKTYISKLASGAIKKPGKDKLREIARVLNIESSQLLKVFTQPKIAAVELNLGSIELDKPTILFNPRQDWGNAPDGMICYGRKTEIETLQQWIITESCRTVTLFGLNGIGKTTLAVTLAQILSKEFDYVFWRNLSNAISIENILRDLLYLLNYKSVKDSSLDKQISQVFSYLRKLRCLLVFDEVESILATGQSLEPYREGYESYGKLLRQIAESQHKSCLLLVSSEKPREMAVLESSSALVHSLQLQGLDSAAQNILQDKELLEEERWDDLIEAYRGHPLALKIVATTIKEVFNGSVSEFLRQNTLFLGDLEFILYQESQRLSDIEKQVICAIASSSQPISLADLSQQFQDKIRSSQIIWSLDILTRRSLVEMNQINKLTFYSLHPVIKKYLNSKC